MSAPLLCVDVDLTRNTLCPETESGRPRCWEPPEAVGLGPGLLTSNNQLGPGLTRAIRRHSGTGALTLVMQGIFVDEEIIKKELIHSSDQ